MVPWPKAAALFRSLYRSFPSLEDEAAESVFAEIARVPDGGEVATYYEVGYGRLWWPEPNRVPHRDAVVGLTFAGLATVARTDSTALLLFNELMRWFRQLAAATDSIGRSPIVDLDSIIPRFANIPASPELRFPRSMFVQMVRQEHGSPIRIEDGGRVDLERSRLRAYRSVRNPDEYWEVLERAVQRRMGEVLKMSNDSREAGLVPSVHIGDSFVVSGTVGNISNRSQSVTQESHVALEAETLEALERAVAEIASMLARLPLAPQDAELARQQVAEIRNEIGRKAVRPGFLRKAFTTLKGLVTPFLLGASSAATDSARSVATAALKAIQAALGLQP
ncbi:hypothetical protein [Leifsonia sp. WHRI 6310E]|uniref:hypothetical protein n=1 Tax=Leifsonia sp. WHRI 6310E TaxID=3162562 RepID=UPI0032F04965